MELRHATLTIYLLFWNESPKNGELNSVIPISMLITYLIDSELQGSDKNQTIKKSKQGMWSWVWNI